MHHKRLLSLTSGQRQMIQLLTLLMLKSCDIIMNSSLMKIDRCLRMVGGQGEGKGQGSR